jgi:hypothetical protein
MSDRVETVKVQDGKSGYIVINKTDFDPKEHKLFKEPEPAEDTAEDLAGLSRAELEKRAKASFADHLGQLSDDDLRTGLQRSSTDAAARARLEAGRNPSGTFSEPTPTDIRYPDKDATEFENNHGAFIGKSAAELRDEKGLPDAPGGLEPDPGFVGGADVTDAGKADAAEAGGATSAAVDPLDHDADGKRGGSLPKTVRK